MILFQAQVLTKFMCHIYLKQQIKSKILGLGSGGGGGGGGGGGEEGAIIVLMILRYTVYNNDSQKDLFYDLWTFFKHCICTVSIAFK